jgi:hypothetical protein
MSDKYYPGQPCPESGRYRAYTPWYDPTYTTKTVSEGDTLPPTPFSGCFYLKEEDL